MGFTVNMNTLFAGIAASIAILGFLLTWRKAVMAEGAHRQEMEDVKKRIDDAEKKVEYIRGCQEESASAVRELSRDMDWVKKALERIEHALVKP